MYESEIMFLYFVGGIVFLIIDIVVLNYLAKIFAQLAEDKGYDYETTKSRVFWLEFFGLGLAGWLYVAAMPNKKVIVSNNTNNSGNKNVVVPSSKVSEAEAVTYNELNSLYKTVKFGTYPQGPNGELLPIKWRVLSTENGYAKLVSVDALDEKAFDDSGTTGIWENCSLRKFLNVEFYNTAFSDEEKEAVIVQNISTPDFNEKNPCSTYDKVYLLSVEDVTNKSYGFDTKTGKSISRWLRPTEYAKFKGVYCSSETGNTYWWLRNAGYVSQDCTMVSASGVVKGFTSTKRSDGGVRPACTVKLDALKDYE